MEEVFFQKLGENWLLQFFTKSQSYIIIMVKKTISRSKSIIDHNSTWFTLTMAEWRLQQGQQPLSTCCSLGRLLTSMIFNHSLTYPNLTQM